MIKYVIFDFDGTLADSKQLFVSAWNSLADKYKFEKIKDEDLDLFKKMTIKERSKKLNFPMYKIPVIVPELYKLFSKSLMEISLFPGIKEMLKDLECNGYQIAIISSNSEENIKEFLLQKELDSISEVLCSSRIFGKDKMIRKFLKSNNLEPREAIYVGDEQRDILACKKTSVKVIWVSWGYDDFEVVQSAVPDYIVSSPKEILEMVRR